MKITTGEWGLCIIAEDARDLFYFGEALGLKAHGDKAQVVRRETHASGTMLIIDDTNTDFWDKRMENLRAAGIVAPKEKFRVIGVDTFDGGDWIQGDFDTLEEALKCARAKGGEMTKMHVYNDKGIHQGQAGTF